MSTERTALSFLLGAAAGGVAALLMAPARGEDTRRKLREGAEDLKERGEGLVAEVKDELVERAETVRSTVEDRADRVGSTAVHQLDAVRSAVAAGADVYREEIASTNGVGS